MKTIKKWMEILFNSILRTDAPKGRTKLRFTSKMKKSDKVITLTINKHQKIRNKMRCRQMIAGLKKNIDALNAQGSKVIFFEMPMHPEICNAPRFGSDFVKPSRDVIRRHRQASGLGVPAGRLGKLKFPVVVGVVEF